MGDLNYTLDRVGYGDFLRVRMGVCFGAYSLLYPVLYVDNSSVGDFP